MKTIKTSLFIIVTLTAVAICPCRAYESEEDYGFASHLIATEDYPEAITFLRRYVLFGDNPARQMNARFIIGSLVCEIEPSRPRRFNLSGNHERSRYRIGIA